MSRDRSMENGDDDRTPGRGWRRMPTPARLVPAAVVLGVPAVLVPVGLLFAGEPGPSAEALPLWAVEAFGPGLLGGATAVAGLPGPALLLVLALPLAVPTAGACSARGPSAAGPRWPGPACSGPSAWRSWPSASCSGWSRPPPRPPRPGSP